MRTSILTCTRPASATAALVLMTSFAANAQSKIGLEILSPSQAKEMWEQLDYWAHDEANLEGCGQKISTEAHVMRGGQACMGDIDPRAIQKVRAYFYDRKRAWQEKRAGNWDCSRPRLQKLRQDITDAASDASQGCSLYNIFGRAAAIMWFKASQ